jgi:hypothetical protein
MCYIRQYRRTRQGREEPVLKYLALAGVVALAFVDSAAGSAVAGGPMICPQYVKPVCATKDGVRKTYNNSCFAAADHAHNITPGACQASRPRFCPMIYQPVCAVKSGARQTYGNSCEAEKAGARIIYSGQCHGPK